MTLNEPEIGAMIATLARAGGLATTAPVIGDAGVPMRAKLLFVIAIAIGVGLNRPGVAIADLPMTATLDLAVGLLTGLIARFVLAKVAIAGQLIGLSLALGFAEQYDPTAGESAGTIRAMFMVLAALAFLASGGLEAVVRCAGASGLRVTEIGALGPELIRQGTAAFGHGLALAGPVVLAALVGNLGLAVLNRATPAVNVFSISLSAVLILGGAVLLATSANLLRGIAAAAGAAANVFTG